MVSLGVICWLGRIDAVSPAQAGLIKGILIYNAAVAGILAYGGLSVGLVGVALWPAVFMHGALAVWCIACLCKRPG